MTSVISRFKRRLSNIGIEVTLTGNIPWVYLTEVNGIRVTEKYSGNHGFTAFYTATKKDSVDRFSDRRKVFSKVRQMVGESHD